jgi:chromatin assembly factor 1 subunit A
MPTLPCSPSRKRPLEDETNDIASINAIVTPSKAIIDSSTVSDAHSTPLSSVPSQLSPPPSSAPPLLVNESELAIPIHSSIGPSAKRRKLTFAEKEQARIEKEAKQKAKEEARAIREAERLSKEQAKKEKQEQIEEERRQKEEARKEKREQQEEKKRLKEVEQARKDEEKTKKERVSFLHKQLVRIMLIICSRNYD